MLPTILHNSNHILDTFMHSSKIILPKSTEQHKTTIHIHNITQNLIFILPNLEINKALLPHFQTMLSLQPKNPIRMRMSHSSQTKFLNHLLNNKVITNTTIHNHIADFTTRLAMSPKQISPLKRFLCPLTNQYSLSQKTLSLFNFLVFSLIHNSSSYVTVLPQTLISSMSFFMTFETSSLKLILTYPLPLINRFWFIFCTFILC